MKNTIGIVGCSYSAGVSGNGDDSWVYELSKMHPEINFVNVSRGGSCLQFAYHVYDQLKELDQFNIEKKIFQITTPWRYTIYPHDFHIRDYLKQLTDNLWILDSEKIKNSDFAFTTPGWLNMSSSKKETLSKFEVNTLDYIFNYYRYTHNESFKINYRSICEKIKKDTSYCFTHNTEAITPKGITSIEELLTTEQFKKYVIDDSSHFNKDGLIEMAKWASKMFITEGNIYDK